MDICQEKETTLKTHTHTYFSFGYVPEITGVDNVSEDEHLQANGLSCDIQSTRCQSLHCREFLPQCNPSPKTTSPSLQTKGNVVKKTEKKERKKGKKEAKCVH